MLRIILTTLAIFIGFQAKALELDAPFSSIDGGELRLSDWRGNAVLVVNTASRCAYTKQYDGLQALYDRYRDKGLVVLAVPSDDFNQELASNEAVKEFCELNYGIDMPMTAITPVKGSKAHPFFASLKRETGFAPRWNFAKVLVGADGAVKATFDSRVAPTSSQMIEAVEASLP